MEWVRKNPMLVVSIAMPLLLAVFFAIRVIEVNVDLPKYKLLFVNNDNDLSNADDNRIKIKVENSHLKATVLAKTSKNSYYRFITLHLYDPLTGSVQNIDISADVKRGGEDITPPELASLKLNRSFVSPDGYTLIDGYYDSPGLDTFTWLFYSSDRYDCFLKKGDYKKRIGGGILCANPQVVGWVVE